MKKTNKILSIILAVAMLLGMVPLTAFAATEALVLKQNSYSKVAYSDNVTQYYRDNNYLYKVTYSNLKNITQVSISYDYGYQLCLHYTRSDTGNSSYEWLHKAKKDIAYTGDLPKTPGSKISLLTTYDELYINKDKPVVTITCLALNAPDWTWNGASATAVFTSADGKAKMTLTPEVTSSTQAAENCLSKDKVTYTATVTANGQTYTNQTTAEGEIGNHSGGTQTCKGYKCDLCKEWYGEANPDAHNWSKLDGVCTLCKNTCAHNNLNGKTCTVCGVELHFHEWIYTANGNKITVTCSNTDGKCDNTNGGYITISAPANLGYDGTAKEVVIDNQLVDFDVSYAYLIDYSTDDSDPPVNAGDYTASIELYGTTASIDFTITPADISAADVIRTEYNYYDGTEQVPYYRVEYDGKILTSDDYDLIAVPQINAGVYTATIKGKGNYAGEQTVSYDIEPKHIKYGSFYVDETLYYNGTKQFPEIRPYIVGGTLTYGEEFYIKDKNYQTDAGDYGTIIYGMGNYNGTIVLRWSIQKCIPTADMFEFTPPEDLVYDGTFKSAKVYPAVSVSGIGEITVKYSADPVNVGTYTVYIDVAEGKNNVAIKNLEIGSFTITPKDISGGEVVLGDALKHSGCEQVMTVESVTVDGMDVTYTVSGDTATNVGVYLLTVTGTGNFCGEITVPYEIKVDTSDIDGINKSNVKSSDIADIEYVLEQLDNAVTDYADEDKLAEWDELRAYCNELLAKEKEIAEEYKRIILAVRGYDESTVTSADKDALIQLDEDIYALALTDNLTEQKIEGLEEAHNKVLALIDKITGISDEIKRIIAAVDAYVFESVKSADKADIEQLIEDIAVLLATQNITADERALLENADETCDKLITKIDDTVAEVERIDSETNAYDNATVTAEDKEEIEQLLIDIDVITDTDNLTDDERIQLNGNMETLETFLETINAVAEEIVRIEDAANAYDESTVKSSDADALNQLKADIKALTDGENITEGERANLAELDATLDALLQKIEDTLAEIERINEAVNAYDVETVKSSDVQALDKLVDDIDDLLNGENLTDDERAALEDNNATIDALNEKLTEVAEEIARVNSAVNGYDESTVKSTDSEDLAQLKADIQALIDSTNVTENEQIALGKMIADVDALEDKIAETQDKLEEIKAIENGYNPETVTSDDKATIEATLAEIEAVNPDNLTDEQKAEYEEIKAELEALLDEIEAANAQVDEIGTELEMFDEKRVTIFSKDEIEALKAKVEELFADTNMGEAEKAKLNEYKAQTEKLIEIINTPAEYFAMRIFWFIWDALHWLSSHVVFIYNWVLAMI